VVDLHCDTPMRMRAEGFDIGKRHDYGQVDIPRMKEGGVTGVFFSIYTSASLEPLVAMKQAFEIIDLVLREAARYPEDVMMAATADGILEAKRAGKIAILLGVEGGHMIDSSPAILRQFHRLGARYLTLTHNRHTPWAHSSSGPPSDVGLTSLGREIVQEMNRLGMAVDVSHVSDKTFYDVLEASSAPVIASHSSCRALADHPRNLSDEMLKALADQGGVVHINYYNFFLDRDLARKADEHPNLNQARAEARKRLQDDPARLEAELRELNNELIRRIGRTPFSTLLDHFEHAAEVAGADHVGLGSDFDGVSDQLPEGMEDISKIPNLVEGLLERGFSPEQVRKILGGNTLRVMREVETHSEASQTQSQVQETS